MPSQPSKGPLSLKGNTTNQATAGTAANEVPVLRLRVISPRQGSQLLESVGGARVHPSSSQAWAGYIRSACFVTLAGGSDCIITIRQDDSVAEGCLELDEVQQHNLHVLPGDCHQFSLFLPPTGEPFRLTAISGEVSLFRGALSSQGPAEVDARQLAHALVKQCLGSVLAVNQAVLVRLGGLTLLVRITATDTLDDEAQEEAIGYHCFRGMMTPETCIYLTAAGGNLQTLTAARGSQQARCAPTNEVAIPQAQHRTSPSSMPIDSAPCGGDHTSAAQTSHGQSDQGVHGHGSSGRIRLVNTRVRSVSSRQQTTVNVYTRDGEWFPVRRRLLRPCINLTKVVRSDEQLAASITVNADTDIFDRVLIYLEAEALGRPTPNFAAHLTEDLLEAAQCLGLRSLEDMCREKLGRLESRLRTYSFDQVRAHNSSGGCWLVLDGMVLDVGRWLPEHPGGSIIIPKQALNLECARFFEMYHVSRESFLYLKEFYIGELDPLERPLVPTPGPPPSEDFLQQLREYTTFRMQLDAPKLFKSF